MVGKSSRGDVVLEGGAVPTQVTGGVAEALLATASGLLIAMLGLVFLNGLNNRVRLLVHQMETLKRMLVNRCVLPVADQSRPERALARAAG